MSHVFSHCTFFPQEFAEMKQCVQVGGSIKAKCTAIEKEVAGGCSAAHFCCCALKDGACHTTLVLNIFSYLFEFLIFQNSLGFLEVGGVRECYNMS